MTDVNYRDLASRWWVQAATPELNKRTRNKPILNAVYQAAGMLGQDTTGLDVYLKQLSPRKSKSDPESLSFYDNSYKYANDRLTKVGPGRFLKKLLPNATDNLVEGFTIWWKENIAFDPNDYKLVVGTTREDFKKAFNNYRRTSSMTYINYRKSISDSCMRYAFPRLPCHPSEAYASGDFEVVTVKDKRGKTRARCVVRVKLLDGSPCYVAGMVYASDNHSAELIEDHLCSREAVQGYKENFWHEARLLKIDVTRGDGFVCPYVDGNRYVTRLDDEFVILVKEGGNYTEAANNTSGYVNLGTGPRCFYNYQSPRW